LPKNKISVIIITANEEENIRECLESVKWADEIIVVDSESADRTIEITKEFTAKTYIRKWQGFASQKRFALEKASNEWVLSIDADERVTPELSTEILSLDLSNADGYYIKRDNYFLGKLIRGCGWGNDYQLRLVRKSKTELTDNLVHEGFVVNGKREKLNSTIIHFTYKSIHQALAKINYYSTLEAKEKYKSKSVSFLKIIFQPLIAFYQDFIARRGYKDGVHGLLISFNNALTKLQVLTKIWELQKNEKSGAN